MSENASESENISKRAPETAKPKGARKFAKKAKGAKKAGPAKEAAGKPEANRSKKAEVIAMMKRAKGATLAEIMEATSWQPHSATKSSDGEDWAQVLYLRRRTVTAMPNSARPAKNTVAGSGVGTRNARISPPGLLGVCMLK